MIGVPYADAPWNEIVPGLWQGGHDWRDTDGVLRDVVVADEFDLVVSLYKRHGCGPTGDGVEELRLIIPDGMLLAADAATAERIAEKAARAVKDGKRVLVRCQAGYNRSGLITALTLIHLGHDAEAAIDLIRAKRSRWALFNGHFLRYVREERVKAGERR